ncbi:hypothetical protein ACFL6N_07185, partial [Thermodesulfobacteriota bacterium]
TIPYAVNMVSVVDRIFDSITDTESALFKRQKMASFQANIRMASRFYAIGNFIDGCKFLQNGLDAIDTFKNNHFNIIANNLSFWIVHMDEENWHRVLVVSTRFMPDDIDKYLLYKISLEKINKLKESSIA